VENGPCATRALRCPVLCPSPNYIQWYVHPPAKRSLGPATNVNPRVTNAAGFTGCTFCVRVRGRRHANRVKFPPEPLLPPPIGACAPPPFPQQVYFGSAFIFWLQMRFSPVLLETEILPRGVYRSEKSSTETGARLGSSTGCFGGHRRRGGMFYTQSVEDPMDGAPLVPSLATGL
jgi:hypothetical protein